jgi:hypothetical protein
MNTGHGNAPMMNTGHGNPPMNTGHGNPPMNTGHGNPPMNTGHGNAPMMNTGHGGNAPMMNTGHGNAQMPQVAQGAVPVTSAPVKSGRRLVWFAVIAVLVGTAIGLVVLLS